MNKRLLLKKLHLPLGLFTLISLALGILVPWRGLFINLATTFFGILITLIYVNRVLVEHQEQQWATVRDRIHSRLEGIANISTHQFRSAFGISADVFSRDPDLVLDPVRRRNESIRVSQEILLPIVSQGIRNLDTEKWKSLIEQMQISWTNIDKVVTIFGGNLPPDLLTLLIDLQDKHWSIQSTYFTFPDLIGVSDDQIEIKGLQHLKTKKAYEELIIDDVKSIMNISAEILQKIV